MIRRGWQSLALWFYQRQFDGAMRRRDLAVANYWIQRMEQAGRW